ncbi:MAG: hypothetical protein H0V53_02995 [Rubrobacter sp.]|nr:hypothetical protein [Rubrobacter sp.]
MSAERRPEDHGGPDGGEALLSVRDLLRVLRRRLWMILVVALISTAAAVGLSLLQTPVYEASIQVLVGQDQGVVTEDASAAAGLQQVTQTMTELANTRTVAEGVIQELDLSATPDQLLGNMTVQQTEQTQVIQISYSDPDPELAATVADTTGEVFSEQVSEVSSDANAVTATVWEQASAPDSPTSPQPLRNGTLGLIMGLMLGVGIAFLREHLDDSWHSPEEAERVSGVPTFGVIRTFDARKKPLGKEKKDAPGPLEG